MFAAITHSLRRRSVLQDAVFDQVFPAEHRLRSWVHWTPVRVALRVAALLAPERGHKVLDVGSGVGKVCLVGAATTSATWFGIEQDADMIRVANTAASRMHLDHRVRFVHGDVTGLDWTAFDAFYLFNPFAEILYSGDEDALARRDRYVDIIDFVQRQLARARPGARVVTYYGFGGAMPHGFDLVHRESAQHDELRLWLKQPSR